MSDIKIISIIFSQVISSVLSVYNITKFFGSFTVKCSLVFTIILFDSTTVEVSFSQ